VPDSGNLSHEAAFRGAPKEPPNVFLEENLRQKIIPHPSELPLEKVPPGKGMKGKKKKNQNKSCQKTKAFSRGRPPHEKCKPTRALPTVNSINE